MKKIFCVIVILFISCTVLFGQKISSEIRCYYIYNETELDTLCNIEYTIHNNTNKCQVIVLSEDSKMDYPMKELIYRRLYKRYEDLSFAQMVWDNIENLSDNTLIPEFFIKTMGPNDTFRITLVLKNENATLADTLFMRHILVLNAEEIDNVNLVNGLLLAIKENHFEYPYSSVVIPWYIMNRFFRKSKDEDALSNYSK